MRRGLCAWHICVVTAVAALTVLAAGCQNTRFAGVQQVRVQRIRDIGRAYAAREADCPKRLRHLADVCRESRARHAKRLPETAELIRVECQRDVRNWREQSPVRRGYLHAALEGRPEKIPDFVVEMIY